MLYVNALRCVQGRGKESRNREIVGRKMNRNEFKRKLGNRILFFFFLHQVIEGKRDEKGDEELMERGIHLSRVK